MKAPLYLSFELLFWIAALLLLATTSQTNATAHQDFSLCPLANMGITWCSGCGIGRSLGHLLHGHIQESFRMHWFGIPALLILLSRIFILFKQLFTKRSLIGREKYYV